jgi:hypothetical protein
MDKFIHIRSDVSKLHDDLVSIFRADRDVEVLSTSLDSPFPDPVGEGASPKGGSGPQSGNSGVTGTPPSVS